MTPENDKHQLIQKARAAYERRRITQQRMADEIGIPRRTLEEWLQGRRVPLSEVLDRHPEILARLISSEESLPAILQN